MVPKGARRAGAWNRLRAVATSLALAATSAARLATTTGALAARLLSSRRRRKRCRRRRRGSRGGDHSREDRLAFPIGDVLGECGESLARGLDRIEHRRNVCENGVHERGKVVVDQISAAAGFDGSVEFYLEVAGPVDQCKHSILCMSCVLGKEGAHKCLETLQDQDKVGEGEAGALHWTAISHEALYPRKSRSVHESDGRVTEAGQLGRFEGKRTTCNVLDVGRELFDDGRVGLGFHKREVIVGGGVLRDGLRLPGQALPRGIS